MTGPSVPPLPYRPPVAWDVSELAETRPFAAATPEGQDGSTWAAARDQSTAPAKAAPAAIRSRTWGVLATTSTRMGRAPNTNVFETASRPPAVIKIAASQTRLQRRLTAEWTR